MPDSSEGSVRGRGPKEMLPERGNPFAFDEGEPRDLTAEELAELYPVGSERAVGDPSLADDYQVGPEDRGAESVRTGVMSPAEDHGLGAIGPPLPEDFFGGGEERTQTGMPEIPMPGAEETEEDRGPFISTRAIPMPSPIADMSGGPTSEKLAAAEDLANLLVPEARLRNLWLRADDLRDRVYRSIDSLHLARQLLDQIEQGRNQLMAGRENYEEAERVLNEVEYRLHHAGRVREWSRTVGNRLLIYEILCAVAIVAGMIFLPSAVSTFVEANFSTVAPEGLVDASTAITTMLWGGLGGVVGALMALRTHIAREQDFDQQWSIWYVTNPIMGIVLGAFVFLVVRAGLLALLPGSEAQIQSTWLLYALAWLAGFQQNVAYKLVERLVSIFDVDSPGASGGGEQ